MTTTNIPSNSQKQTNCYNDCCKKIGDATSFLTQKVQNIANQFFSLFQNVFSFLCCCLRSQSSSKVPLAGRVSTPPGTPATPPQPPTSSDPSVNKQPTDLVLSDKPATDLQDLGNTSTRSTSPTNENLTDPSQHTPEVGIGTRSPSGNVTVEETREESPTNSDQFPADAFDAFLTGPKSENFNTTDKAKEAALNRFFGTSKRPERIVTPPPRSEPIFVPTPTDRGLHKPAALAEVYNSFFSDDSVIGTDQDDDVSMPFREVQSINVTQVNESTLVDTPIKPNESTRSELPISTSSHISETSRRRNSREPSEKAANGMLTLSPEELADIQRNFSQLIVQDIHASESQLAEQNRLKETYTSLQILFALSIDESVKTQASASSNEAWRKQFTGHLKKELDKNTFYATNKTALADSLVAGLQKGNRERFSGLIERAGAEALVNLALGIETKASKARAHSR